MAAVVNILIAQLRDTQCDILALRLEVREVLRVGPKGPLTKALLGVRATKKIVHENGDIVRYQIIVCECFAKGLLRYN